MRTVPVFLEVPRTPTNEIGGRVQRMAPGMVPGVTRKRVHRFAAVLTGPTRRFPPVGPGKSKDQRMPSGPAEARPHSPTPLA